MDSIFIEYFGNSPQMRIIEYIVDSKDFNFTFLDILEGTGLKKEITYEKADSIVNKYLKEDLIVKIDDNHYKVNKDSLIFRNFYELNKYLIQKQEEKI